MKSITQFFFVVAIAATTSFIVPVAHAQHLYAGLVDTNGTAGLQIGDALSFVDPATGAPIAGTGLGLQPMSLVTVGAQAGLYMNNSYTFTALSDGLNWTGSGYRLANSFAAKSGTFVQIEILSVTGPVGAEFSFWDLGANSTAPVTTFTIGTGITSGAGLWNLTDPTLIVGDGVTTNPAPTTVQETTGTDPYGHIHNRSWTADQPGTYTVSYILHDANNGQADSAPFTVTYGAVPEPSSAILAAVGGLGFLGVMRRRNRA